MNYCHNRECDDCQAEIRAEALNCRAIKLADESVERTEIGEFVRFEEVISHD